MSLLNRLERRFGRFALPHVTLGLIVVQVIVYLMGRYYMAQDRPEVLERLELIPTKVLAGEPWRLLTFLALPPFTNPVFAFFFWYLFYLMGTSLEHYWGTFRFNVYLLIGYAATAAASFLAPDRPASNLFLEASVFLAFAFLNPDFELYLFFILPVKIKWLALLHWIIYGLLVLFGDWSTRAEVSASVLNFFVFFSRDVVEKVRAGRRRMAVQAGRFAREREPAYYHRCLVCGITDRTHPRMEFRYCSKCDGTCGYCTDHLHNHEHVKEAREVPP